MIFGINTTSDNLKILSKFTRLTAREIKKNNFEISLVVLMPNITTNHAITYTNKMQLHFQIHFVEVISFSYLDSLFS